MVHESELVAVNSVHFTIFSFLLGGRLVLTAMLHEIFPSPELLLVFGREQILSHQLKIFLQQL